MLTALNVLLGIIALFCLFCVWLGFEVWRAGGFKDQLLPPSEPWRPRQSAIDALLEREVQQPK